MACEDTGNQTQSQRGIATEVVWQGALAGLGDSDAAERLRMRLDGPVPWPEVVTEAQRLGLAPLFHLGSHSSPALRAMVPPPATEALRHATHLSATRVTRLERACADIVMAATAAGIRILVLKGLALGALVYPSAMARPMDDADLLVTPTDREKLAAILHGFGYRNDLRGEEDFYVPGMAYSIDLHTGLLNTTRVPARGALWPVTFDELWARSQACILGGIPVRTLGPLDTILHVAIHAVHHHGLNGARWMVDLLACLRAWPLDLSDVLDSPSALRRSLWYCLEILAGRGQDPVSHIRSTIRPAWVFPAENWVLAAANKGEVPEAIRYAFTLACLPRWTAKTAFFRQLLFPRTAVFTDAFKDAGNSAPSRGEHWSLAMQYCRQALKAALAGRTQSSKRSPGPN
jgi:hypothetical protein